MASLSTQFAFRTQKNVGLVGAAPSYGPISGSNFPAAGTYRCANYSPNGKYFAYAGVEDVKIVNPDDGSILGSIPAPNVHDLYFSPRGTYVTTWERTSKQEDGNATKNFKIWRTESGELVHAFVQKNINPLNFQYTYDEKYCARAVTNEIQFFESDKLNTVWGHLRLEGVTDFALSPGKNYSVACFVAERKGMPAMVRTYTVPDFANHTTTKSFFKADKVTLSWNKLGTSVLVLTQTEVDKTGKSYYGETNLYLMTPAQGFDCRVSLDKDGPIHDVAWSPNSLEFGVVYGYMPAKTTIFNKMANPIHSLPLGPRNTILFSPHGRFVAVAGFGNLQGQMDIYDRDRNMTKITTIEASNASVCEWGPDGQHILTATTSPRLRVDNGVKIWHFTGPLQYCEELDELYNVYWRPQPIESFPLSNPLPNAPAAHASAANHVSAKPAAKPAGAYRPPHARGSATPLLFKREDEGGAAHSNGSFTASNGANGFGKNRKREVPGAAPAEVPGAAPGGGVSLAGALDGDAQLSKSALKNKKKREAAKRAKEQGEAQGAQGGNGNGNGNGNQNANGDQREPRDARSNNDRRRQDHRSRSRHPADQRRSKSRNNADRNGGGAGSGGNGQNGAAPRDPTRLSPHTITAANLAAPEGPLSPSPEEKKRRALHKKLRAIEELKMRQASGEKLEDTQIKKIATESEIRRELDKLGGA